MNGDVTAQPGLPLTGAEIQGQLETFGKALTQAYVRVGLSKRALAGAASLDRGAIGRIERGLRAPNFVKLLLLARVTKSTPAALLAGIGTEAASIPPIDYDGDPPTDPLRRLGANLRWIRQHSEPQMTQEGLALEAGIDRSSPNGYETGRMCPNLRTILKLAAGLRVTPSMLLEGVELTG